MRYVLHLHNHAGWSTQKIEASMVAEAIQKGLDKTAEFLSKEYQGNYRIEHDDPNSDFPRYRVVWDGNGIKSFPLSPDILQKGDVWWSDRFQVGEDDDCTKCGGTGRNHYNPFVQCWSCGDDKQPGRGSGKHPAGVKG